MNLNKNAILGIAFWIGVGVFAPKAYAFPSLKDFIKTNLGIYATLNGHSGFLTIHSINIPPAIKLGSAAVSFLLSANPWMSQFVGLGGRFALEKYRWLRFHPDDPEAAKETLALLKHRKAQVAVLETLKELKDLSLTQLRNQYGQHNRFDIITGKLILDLKFVKVTKTYLVPIYNDSIEFGRLSGNSGAPARYAEQKEDAIEVQISHGTSYLFYRIESNDTWNDSLIEATGKPDDLKIQIITPNCRDLLPYYELYVPHQVLF